MIVSNNAIHSACKLSWLKSIFHQIKQTCQLVMKENYKNIRKRSCLSYEISFPENFLISHLTDPNAGKCHIFNAKDNHLLISAMPRVCDWSKDECVRFDDHKVKKDQVG